jgi:hypothetical protein
MLQYFPKRHQVGPRHRWADLGVRRRCAALAPLTPLALAPPIVLLGAPRTARKPTNLPGERRDLVAPDHAGLRFGRFLDLAGGDLPVDHLVEFTGIHRSYSANWIGWPHHAP